jgi:hypothetical protein
MISPTGRRQSGFVRFFALIGGFKTFRPPARGPSEQLRERVDQLWPLDLEYALAVDEGDQGPSRRSGAGRRFRQSAPPALLLYHPIFHPMNQLTEWHVQCVRDGPDADRGRIQDAPLHSAEVRPFESAFGAEAFLRETRCPPEFRNGCTNGFPLQVGRLYLTGEPLHPNAQ